jgi:hypothetical protein
MLHFKDFPSNILTIPVYKAALKINVRKTFLNITNVSIGQRMESAVELIVNIQHQMMGERPTHAVVNT